MPPTYHSLPSALASSLDSTSRRKSRPLTTQLFCPRSTKTTSVSLGLVGGIIAIGLLALLCVAGAWLTIHVHYCRQSGCSACCVVISFKRWSSHSAQAHDQNPSRVQAHRNEYSQTPRDRVVQFQPSIQDIRISSPTHFSSLTPPPTLHTRREQSSDRATANPVVTTRGPEIPSAISDDYAPALRASETTVSFLSPRDSTSLARLVALPSNTLDSSPNLSASASTITLPSFVQQEYPDPMPSPQLVQRNLAMAEGARPLPSSIRSSLPSSRSRSAVENATPPTTASFETSLRLDVPLVSDRLPHLHHWTRSPLSRRAGVRYESSTAKLKSAARAEVVKIVRPGTPTSGGSRINSLRCDAPPPLAIPTHTVPSPGDHDSFSFGERCLLREGQDTGLVSNSLLQSSLPKPSRETLPVPVEPERAPPGLYTEDIINLSPSHQSPGLGSLSSPSSSTTPNENRSRVNSRATSSMSTIPSLSAFPSPPNFTPGLRDKMLSILRYSTISQSLPPATFQEYSPTRGAETTSPNKGRASARLSDADALRLMTTVNSRSVSSRHIRSELMGRDTMSVRSRGISKISSLRRLSRVPLGPRRMYGGSRPLLRRKSQLSSV
ncbi:hypothetical protein BJ322DRAFT_650722 [Thelephora terrestris]|uniref:Uncharacterized protein n=1 Tax=Thelephora terrestris TaxID=56493 RepID=A0A9P6L9L8_9AGAM|nr:hypothetical protein BJ322DRAFT_650722 [Thelephora terrestris]